MSEAIYQECKCLPSELASILERAVSGLKKIEGVVVSDVAAQRSAKEKLDRDTLISMGLPEAMIEAGIANLKQKYDVEFPVSASDKLWSSVDNYIESCKCPTGQDTDWKMNRYTEWGIKTPRAARTPGSTGQAFVTQKSKVYAVPSTDLRNKYDYADEVIKKVETWFIHGSGKETLCRDLADVKGWAGTEVYEGAVKQGIIDHTEFETMKRFSKDIENSPAGTKLFEASKSRIYSVRKKDVSCPINPSAYDRT